MRKSILLCGAILAVAMAASAQEQPRVEAFAGYSYMRMNIPTSPFAFTSSNTSGIGFNGGSGQVSFNLTNWLGAVADFGGYTSNSLDLPTDTNVISYMFGPRVWMGSGRLRPFGEALFGGARISDSLVNFGSENAFAMAVGGGLDYDVTSHFAVRPVEADYFLTKFSDGVNDRQNNLRLSAGVVFRFGR